MGVAPENIIFAVILSFKVALLSSPNIQKKVKTNKCKEKFVILQSIGIKVMKQGQSSTPTDIPVGIF